jgi:hypothetical protein
MLSRLPGASAFPCARMPAVVRAGDHAHTAVFAVGGVHGVPGRDRLRRLQPPIGYVLVPGDPLLVPPVLAEKVRGEQQNVWPDQRLHRVQDRRVRRQFPDKRLVEVPVEQPDARLVAPLRRFQRVEPAAGTRQPEPRQRPEGRQG